MLKPTIFHQNSENIWSIFRAITCIFKFSNICEILLSKLFSLFKQQGMPSDKNNIDKRPKNKIHICRYKCYESFLKIFLIN